MEGRNAVQRRTSATFFLGSDAAALTERWRRYSRRKFPELLSPEKAAAKQEARV